MFVQFATVCDTASVFEFIAECDDNTSRAAAIAVSRAFAFFEFHCSQMLDDLLGLKMLASHNLNRPFGPRLTFHLDQFKPARSNWGEYKKGICEVSVSRMENFIPMQRPEDCKYIAERYAQTVADRLAEVSFAKVRSNQSLEYDVKKGSLHVGKLLVSPVECRFQSFQTVMEKLIP